MAKIISMDARKVLADLPYKTTTRKEDCVFDNGAIMFIHCSYRRINTILRAQEKTRKKAS